ncbi:O-antigen ligase family protein [Azospirillum sp. sgz302134]
MLGLTLIATPFGPVKAAALAVGAGTAVAVAIQPLLGLPLLLFLVQGNLPTVAEVNHGIPDVGKLLPLYVFGVLLLRFAVLGTWPRFRVGVLLPPLVYGLVCSFSLFHAARPEIVGKELIDFGKDFLLMALVVVLLTDRRLIRPSAWAWIAAGTLSGTLVVFQSLTGNFEQTFGGLANSMVQHIAGESNAPRPSGPLPDPNYFAQIMLFVVPIAFDRCLNDPNRHGRLLAGWATLVSVLAIIFTYSRGGLLCLSVFLLVIAWRHRRSRLLWIGTAVVTVILASTLSADFFDRILHLASSLQGGASGSSEDAAVRGRSGEMMAAWAMFLDHPWVGIGVGHYESMYQKYSLELGNVIRGVDRNAHSLYLQVAAEQGVLGLAALGLVIWASLSTLLRARRALILQKDADTARIVGAVGFGFVLYLLAATFLHDAFARFFWLYVAFALALSQVVAQPSGTFPRPRSTPGRINR